MEVLRAIWRLVRPLIGPGAAGTAFGFVMSYWSGITSWLYGEMPEPWVVGLAKVPSSAAALIAALLVLLAVVMLELVVALYRPRPLHIVYDEKDSRCAAERYFAVGVRNTDSEGRSLMHVSLRMQPNSETRDIHRYFGLDPDKDYVMAQWDALDAEATNYVKVIGRDSTPAEPLRFTLEARARDARTAYATFEYNCEARPVFRQVARSN